MCVCVCVCVLEGGGPQRRQLGGGPEAGNGEWRAASEQAQALSP